ncbi:hypothetical protein [Mesorhizobium waimense]|nr:hypothetical protein [Mesorhizobium waimense]
MAGRQRLIDEDQKLELLQRMEAGETVSKLEHRSPTTLRVA